MKRPYRPPFDKLETPEERAAHGDLTSHKRKTGGRVEEGVWLGMAAVELALTVATPPRPTTASIGRDGIGEGAARLL
jgi:hypothetical protein